MGESLLPSQDQVVAYTRNLANHLANVPEVHQVLELAETQPETVRQIYARYTELIDAMANLSPEEQLLIQTAKERLSERHGHTGSADETTAAELVSEVSDNSVLPSIAVQALIPNQTMDEALSVLAERMEGGHQLKVSGKTPD